MKASFLIVVMAATCVACGGDDDSDSKNGTGGSATGGKSGSGGGGGSGGSTGGSGGSTGGSGGSGATGGSGGSAGASGGAAGTSGAGGSAGGTGVICGGKGGTLCEGGQYCDFSDQASCGATDQTGECKIAGNCTTTCSPVCGCDGESYCNACIANTHGTDTTSDKSCVPGNGGAQAPCFVDGDCKTGFKCCRECGAFDCPQSCTEVSSGANCPATP